MISRGRLLFILLSLATVLLVVGGTLMASTARDRDDGADSLYKYLSVFLEVLRLVDRAYVDETDPAVLMAGALEGTADALDPFSLYVPAAEVERFVASRAIGARRSGLVVLKERGVAYAVSVVRGSPADRAGIERGDLLAIIDKLSTRETPLWKIQQVLAGPVGTAIEVERVRVGKRETVTVTLDDFPYPGVVLETHRGVATLRVDAIAADTVQNVETSLATLAGEGPALPALEARDKLVVDLRGVAGGDQEAAYRVAALFADGALGALTFREETLESFTSELAPRWQGSIAVLIDRGTQGAAEILASVLQQSAGARLVGERSFGHSGRQTLLELSNGDRVQITNAFFTGPDGTPIRGALQPDVPVRRSIFEDEDESADPVLDRGLEVVLGEADAPAEELAA